MTRYEYMKNVGFEKFTSALCMISTCEVCCARGKCELMKGGENGFMEWLKQEMPTNDRD